MILLVTMALRTLRERHSDPRVGRLVQPRHFSSLSEDQGMPWAADNDCFNGGLDRPGFEKMLDAVGACPSPPLFVTAPDVVADAAATLDLFELWEPLLRERGLPVALVAQDGLEEPPWERIDALFIGGSTDWKLGADAAQLLREAKARGLHVHVGRINSMKRAWRFSSLGADSMDGSGFSRWPARWIPWFLERLDDPRADQGVLL